MQTGKACSSISNKNPNAIKAIANTVNRCADIINKQNKSSRWCANATIPRTMFKYYQQKLRIFSKKRYAKTVTQKASTNTINNNEK